jgi:hypothetical protein
LTATGNREGHEGLEATEIREVTENREPWTRGKISTTEDTGITARRAAHVDYESQDVI